MMIHIEGDDSNLDILNDDGNNNNQGLVIDEDL